MDDRYRAEYDVYRGDSFQLLVRSAPSAAVVAILIRSKLIACSPKTDQRWDARIAIGIGEMTYRGKGPADSDGPAFHLSADGLADLSKSGDRLIINTPWPAVDKNLSLLTRFADDRISSWSQYSGETAYHNLLYQESQTDLAKRLHKGQSTISDRMATAKLDLIRAYIQRVEECIGEGLQS